MNDLSRNLRENVYNYVNRQLKLVELEFYSLAAARTIKLVFRVHGGYELTDSLHFSCLYFLLWILLKKKKIKWHKAFIKKSFKSLALLMSFLFSHVLLWIPRLWCVMRSSSLASIAIMNHLIHYCLLRWYLSIFITMDHNEDSFEFPCVFFAIPINIKTEKYILYIMRVSDAEEKSVAWQFNKQSEWSIVNKYLKKNSSFNLINFIKINIFNSFR